MNDSYHQQLLDAATFFALGFGFIAVCWLVYSIGDWVVALTRKGNSWRS